jgi:hypothetical protein
MVPLTNHFERYYYNAWRPITAIRHPEKWLLSGKNVFQPSWLPLLTPTPPHPEYISGHSTLAAAAAEVLRRHLGDKISLTISSNPKRDGREASNLTFTSLTEMVHSTSNSRVWGGVCASFRFIPFAHRLYKNPECSSLNWA